MTSCEPHRNSVYSEDLRWRMVWQYIRRLRTHASRSWQKSWSTVTRTIQLFYATGSVSKKEYPKDKTFKKLTGPAQMLILNLVVTRPGIFLQEIQKELLLTLLVQVDVSTICRFLQQNGMTRQKLTLVAIQRDEFLRQQYSLDVSLYSPEMFIFLDETGSDRRNLIRKHGYSLRGIPARRNTLLVRGERVSAIAFMSVNGLLDVKVFTGTSDGDLFYDFLHTHLLPQLLPFDGVNPYSVVVMDNCSIHHVPEIQRVIEDVGALLHFLPTYSPDLNPIEEAFSKVKSELKHVEDDMGTSDMETLLLAAFTSITPEDCQGWISHCNI